MITDPRAQPAELRGLSMAELKQRWRNLIGTDPVGYRNSSQLSGRSVSSPHRFASGVPSLAVIRQEIAQTPLPRPRPL